MIKTNIFRSPILWLGLALLAPFLPVLLLPAGRVFGNPQCDNPAMFYYINDFAGQCWRQGVIPLWNPHIMMGMPFLGEGQAAIFHPMSWLFILLPTGVAINWFVALSFLLTGLFFYGWLRALKLGQAASFCGALVWSYSNVLIVRIYAGHLTILLELIEMPLILLLWERYRQKQRIVYLAGIALAYGAMALAAYPQLLYIFSLFFLIYVLLESALECTSRQAALRQAGAIVLLGIFILLGTGIGAVQLLPTADYAAQSFRQKATYEFCGSFSFLPENLMTVVAPRFFGYTPEPGPAEYWNLGNYWEMTFYIGLLPLVLVVPGFWAAPWRRRVTLAVCAAVFFVVGLGCFTPLFPLIYKYVPFFNVFRGPSKNILMTELCLVTLAAYGIDGLLREAEQGRHRLLKAALGATVAVLLAIAGIYFYYLPGALEQGSHWRHLLVRGVGDQLDKVPVEQMKNMIGWTLQELLRSGIIALAILIVLILAWKARRPRVLLPLLLCTIMADLLYVFIPLLQTYKESEHTRLPEPLVAPLKRTPYPERVLVPGWMTNVVMHYGLSSASGYTGNTLARYNNFVNLGLGSPLDTPQLEDPIRFYLPPLRFLGIEAEILPTEIIKPGTPFEAQADDRALVRIANPFPRAWLAAAPVSVQSEDEALNYALTQGLDLQGRPAIEHEAAGVEAGPVGLTESVQISAFTPTRVELEVNAAQPRVLVLCEMYEKNWTARVNGKAAAVFPANYLLRGVEVPAGPSRVIFEYRPAAFRRGAALSLLSLAGVLGAGVLSVRRRRGAPGGGPATSKPEAAKTAAPKTATPPASPASPAAGSRNKKGAGTARK